LRIGNWLIPKISVSRPDRARDAIDLVAATVRPPGRIVEHSIFGVDFVDGGPPTRGVVFTEHVLKIASQQDRYAGHGLSPFLHRVRLCFVGFSRSLLCVGVAASGL